LHPGLGMSLDTRALSATRIGRDKAMKTNTTTGSVLLTTADAELGIVPRATARMIAAQEALHIGCTVAVRDPITDGAL
jgi:hypothetical protein